MKKKKKKSEQLDRSAGALMAIRSVVNVLVKMDVEDVSFWKRKLDQIDRMAAYGLGNDPSQGDMVITDEGVVSPV